MDSSIYRVYGCKNDNQHNETQHNSRVYYFYAKHGFSECYYGECRFVESRGTIKRQKNIVGYTVFTFILQFYYIDLQVFAQTP